MIAATACRPDPSIVVVVLALLAASAFAVGVAFGRSRPAGSRPVERQAQRQLFLAERAAGIGSWRLSLPDGELSWSDGACRVLGLDPAGPAPPTLEAALALFEAGGDRLRDGIARAIADRTDIALELTLRRTDGECRELLFGLHPEVTADGATPEALFAVVSDVTERRPTEALGDDLPATAGRNERLQGAARHLTAERSRARTADGDEARLLAGLGCELREPSILSRDQARRSSSQPGLAGQQREAAEATLVASEQILVALDRPATRSAVEDRTGPVDMPSLARQCLDLARPTAERSGLVLQLVQRPGAPSRVAGDPVRLRQIVLGLLQYAVSGATAGPIELRLCPAACGSGLRVEVVGGEEAGPPAGVDRTADLAEWARLASLLGGTLVVQTRPGGGSLLALDLPLAGRPATADRAPIVPAAAPRPNKRVLVVDDVAMNRDIAGSFLRAAGHVVTEVDGGLPAVRMAEHHDYDLVLMDIRMPDIDGLEATRRIRALGGPRASVRIVALTAHAFAEQVAACQEAGMDGHLAKPFTPDALLATLAAGNDTRARVGGF